MDSTTQGGALPRQKIALLLDFDNMILGIEDPGFDIEVVTNALRERGIMVLGRAYGDWYRHSRHRRRLMEQGIDLIETPVFGPIIKNSADMHMALDAFEIAHTQAHIDTFCIVSGDSDFLPLIKRLQTRDKNVIVVAGQKFTSDLVRRNCNEYLSYENLLAEALGAHEDVSVIEGAFQLLERSIHTLHERGIEVRSSTLKQMMVQLNPMFSERTFGCAQFRQFLEKASRAGVATLDGRDPHSGEMIVSLAEDSASRIETRDVRSDGRGDTRNERPEVRGRLEPRDRDRDFREPQREARETPRDRFDRFDRFEPQPRGEGRGGRFDNRAPGRAEPQREENRAEPVREPAPAEEMPSQVLETAETTPEEPSAESREGRRHRGGRGRVRAEARETIEIVPEIAPEASNEVLESNESPEVLEVGAQGSEPQAEARAEEAPTFVDRNSQLGRVPLRRGRLRFSAKLGRAVPVEETAPVETAPEAAAAEPTEVETPVLDALEVDNALPESDPLASIFPTSTEDVAPSEAALEPEVQTPAEAAPAEAATEPTAEPEAEAEAKPKRRAPRRKTPRKKDAPEEAAPAEAEASTNTEAAPVAEPDPAAVEAPVAEAPDVEAEAAPEAAPVAEEGEASAKPKRRAPRRKTSRKKDAPEESQSPDAAAQAQSEEA